MLEKEKKDFWKSLNKKWRIIFSRHLNKDKLTFSDIDEILRLKEIKCYEKITTLEPLRELKNLKKFWCGVYNTKITSLEPLRNLKRLKFLRLYDSNVFDLEPIKDLKNLVMIQLSCKKIVNLEPLKNLINLKWLECHCSEVSDIEPLKYLINLERLDLSYTKITDLEPLKNLINLKSLRFISTMISDLKPLKNLKNLEKLSCSETKIKDLEPLRSLKKLEYINIRDAQVSSLEPLKNLINLQNIGCGNTQVTSIKPLIDLKNLNYLDIYGCPIKGSNHTYRFNNYKEVKFFIENTDKRDEFNLNKDKIHYKKIGENLDIQLVYYKNKSLYVPEWKGYWPILEYTSDKQKEFYDFWKEQFEKNIIVDIRGNLCYLFVYIYSIIKHFINDKNINKLLLNFAKMDMGYGDKYYSISHYLQSWLFDAYLYIGNYDDAWEVKTIYGFCNIEDAINFKSRCKDTSINGEELLHVVNKTNYNSLTKFGKKHVIEITQLSDIYLKEFYKIHERSLIKYFTYKLKNRRLKNNNWYAKSTGKGDATFWMFRGIPGITGIPLYYKKITEKVYKRIITEACNIVRECENKVREEKGVYKIGERWIEETELFYKLCKAFPKEKIIQHGKPTWLYRQHLDIYFPKRNIGIEYQGVQHQKVIQYFGGEEALEERKNLDEQKRFLCKKHNCKLIYVYEDYDIKEVIKEINSLL
ncbi:MAG: leucine-rich repeat domain-containing protein [Candidatus Cloacimonadota bacterium]|nr:leucine-rich repeat domain-containing protein [Candidatus Cloacimonadota bacterium]